MSDSGIGISEAGMTRLFQPFSQTETDITRRFGGTGLGLSICRRLADLMGGAVRAESRIGQGSTFTAEVNLPLAPRSQTGIAAEPNLKGLRILLLIDDAQFGDDVARYLRAVGSTVIRSQRRADIGAVAADVVVADAPPASGRPAAGAGDAAIVLLAGWDAGRTRPPGIAAMVPRPLRKAALLGAVAIAAGRASPEIDAGTVRSAVVSEMPTVEEALRQNRLILVADDHPINRQVILRQLNRLGYAAEAVIDGVEALKALAEKPYALLMTDCHMPELDGFALTDRIRGDERHSGRPRLPIIAITANALLGEAERCLAAGMDGYLAKPIEMPRLREELRRWMPTRHGEANDVADPQATSPATAQELGPPVDPAVLATLFGDDRDTIRELFTEFVKAGRDMLAELDAAVAARSNDRVMQAGHKLKGSSRTAGAVGLAEFGAILEEAGKAGDWQRIDGIAARVAAELLRVEQYVSEL